MERDKLSCAAWVSELDRSLAAIEGPVVLVAHSAGVMITVHWAHAPPASDPLARCSPRRRISSRRCPKAILREAVLLENGWLPTPRERLPFPSIVAASTNDPLASYERVASLAAAWGSRLVDVGAVGHLNPAAGYGPWPQAESFVERALGVNAAARAAQWRGQLLEAWPGLVLAIVIAIASTFIAEQRGGPTLLYALLIGMALNPIASEGRAKQASISRRAACCGWAWRCSGARITFEQIGATWLEHGPSHWSAPWPRPLAFRHGSRAVLGQRCRFGVLTGGATAICARLGRDRDRLGASARRTVRARARLHRCRRHRAIDARDDSLPGDRRLVRPRCAAGRHIPRRHDPRRRAGRRRGL